MQIKYVPLKHIILHEFYLIFVNYINHFDIKKITRYSLALFLLMRKHKYY